MNRLPQLGLLGIGMTILFAPPSPGIDPDTLHRELQARDARFDNLRLDYKKSGISVQPEVVLSADGKVAGCNNTRMQHIPYEIEESFVARGTEVTLIRVDERTNEERREAAPDARMEATNPFSMQSNLKAMVRFLYGDPKQIRGYGSNLHLMVLQRTHPVDQVMVKAMRIEFAFGGGIGSRIKRIEYVLPTDQGWKAVGSLQVYELDTTSFEIELDEKFIVREGTVSVMHGERETQYRFRSEGTVEQDGVHFARSGTCTWSERWWQNGEASEFYLREEIGVKLSNVQVALDDRTYKAFIEMKAPDGTSVDDHIGRVRYKVGDKVALKRSARTLREIVSRRRVLD
jgi:hypothetical protein